MDRVILLKTQLDEAAKLAKEKTYRHKRLAVILLNNQFETKIDITKYFKGPDTNTIETIIEKLYRYRNDIAHGNISDFENELQILKDKRDNIPDFLRTLLKKILIHAIREPKLIKDLKEC